MGEISPTNTKISQRVLFKDTVERNFITVGRAAQEFLLKPTQLEGLPKYSRRSPYESEVTITVYARKDVMKRAIEIWGSLEDLEKEKKHRERNQKDIYQTNYEAKKYLRDARRENSHSETPPFVNKKKCGNRESLLIGLAISVDIMNVSFKLAVYLIVGSESLLAETIHSIADTLNQSILLIGLYQMAQRANSRHPYGYSNTMYVASLISAVGIFCLGSAVSIFNGIVAATTPRCHLDFKEVTWAFIVLGFSFCTEGICLCCTIASACKSAKKFKLKFFNYVFTSTEPGVIAILLEDLAAVLGNIIAALMLAISWKTNSHIPDAVGCIAIGLLLGSVALFLIVTNSAALVGRSIRAERLEGINKLVESDVMIRALYDVKGIDIGNNLVRYKAELDFDGAELTRLYLDRMDLNNLLEEVKKIKNIDYLEEFMVTHGENIVDLLGGEIDRIELKIRSHFPEVRHVDLEIV